MSSDDPKRPRQRDSSEPPPRPREASEQPAPHSAGHPIGTPRGFSSGVGILAPAAWLAARGLFVAPDKAWHATAALSCAERLDTKLYIRIRHDEWGVRFAHGSRSSEINVRNSMTVQGADDHGLMGLAPSLRDLGAMVRELERRFAVRFHRAHAVIETSIPGAEPIIRAWIVSL